MAKQSSGSGQRGVLSSASGQKGRSPTSTSHKGSRVDPSHVTQQKRDTRAKKTSRDAKR